MISGYISRQSVEVRLLCTKDTEECSDDFKVPYKWIDPSKVLPKAGIEYQALISYGIRLTYDKDKCPSFCLSFQCTIYTNRYTRDRLIVFSSLEALNRYFTIIQED